MSRLILFLAIFWGLLLGSKGDDVVELVRKASWSGFANTITIASVESTEFSYDGNYVSLYYLLKKALTMTGAKELGFFSFPYDSLYWNVYIKKARIIKPSGKIIELDSTSIKDEEMKSIFGLVFYSSLRQKSISFPSVEIGDGVELEIVFETKKPRIEGVFDGQSMFVDDEPVKYTRTVLIGPADVKLNTAIINDKEGKIKFTHKKKGKKQKFVWEARECAPIIEERGMAPISDIAPQVLWSNTTWKELSRKVYEIVEPMMEPDSAIIAKVNELTAGIDDEEEKMRRIFFYVAQEVRYVGVPLGEREGIQPHPACWTFSRGVGVCKDKATLLASMLKTAGIEAYTVLTNPTNKIFKIVALSNFNHMITAAKLKNGRIYFMDSTDEFAHDLLPAYSYNKEYLPIVADGSDLMVFPVQPPEENSEVVKITTNLSHTGLMNATIEFLPQGFYDEIWRMIIRNTGSKEKIRQFFLKLVKSIHPNCKLESYNIEPAEIKNLAEPVRIKLVISSEDYAIPAGKYFLFKPIGYLQSLNILSFLLDMITTIEKREYPVDLHLTFSHRIKEEIVFPPGFGVEIAPEGKSFKSDLGDYFVELKDEGNGMKFESSLVIRDSYIEPKEYPSLKSIGELMKSGEKGYVFLVKEEK